MTTLNAGTGLDGDAVASSNTNLNTTSLVGRGYGDMVSYSCSAVGTQGCTVTATPDGLTVGDEVLLINLRGVGYNGGTDVVSEGNYEAFEIDAINGTNITFTTAKTKSYGNVDGTDLCFGSGGTATANRVSEGAIAYAFNNNTFDPYFWGLRDVSSGEWLKYEFTSAQTVVKYGISPSNWANLSPTAWSFYGSNDDTNWTLLDSRSGIGSWSVNTYKYYNCDTASGSFLYYKLIFTGFVSGDMFIGGVEMFGATDTNIGTTTASNQKVMLQRIPNYNNFTVNGGVSVYSNSYSPKDGVIFLRVKDTFTINGNIDVTGHGPTGGTTGGSGPYPNADGGIGHPAPGIGYSGGATGGSHATQGQQAESSPAPTYGSQELTKLQMGSGGASTRTGGGGSGGGVIALFATTLHLYGQLYAKGNAGGNASTYPGGGGSGGSILIQAGTLYMHSSTTSLIGGAGGTGTPYTGGTGGEGILAIYYNTLGDSITGADVTPYTDDQLQLPYNISGTASEACTIRIYDSSWVFVKSEAVSGGAYEIVNLPNAGPFYVISEADNSGKNLISYKSVVPAQ